VFPLVPNDKVADMARTLKAIHAQQDRAATHTKEFAAKLEKTNLGTIAMLVHNLVSQTLT
jgi:hypothetical protein